MYLFIYFFKHEQKYTVTSVLLLVHTSLNCTLVVGYYYETFATFKHCEVYWCYYSATKLLHSYRVLKKVTRLSDVISRDFFYFTLYSILICCLLFSLSFFMHWTVLFIFQLQWLLVQASKEAWCWSYTGWKVSVEYGLWCGNVSVWLVAFVSTLMNFENGYLNHIIVLNKNLVIVLLEFRFISWFIQANGMNYLHQLQPPIVHRDLKSPNLLVDSTFTVKVSIEKRELCSEKSR